MNTVGSACGHAAGTPQSLLVARLLERLGATGALTQVADRASYEASARHGRGTARAVVRPATAEDLAWAVKELANADAAFVVQGAATGLVGAATPTMDGTQWIVSTQRLRDRLEIDPINRSATVSAGFRLSDLNKAAAEHGLTLPIDLGADPSIGGMVATNTGGARLIRYGGVRENLLAVAGVLAHPAGDCVGRGAFAILGISAMAACTSTSSCLPQRAPRTSRRCERRCTAWWSKTLTAASVPSTASARTTNPATGA